MAIRALVASPKKGSALAGNQTDLRRFVRTYPGALDDDLIAELLAVEDGRIRSEAEWRRCSLTPVAGDVLTRFSHVTDKCFADYRTLSRILNYCDLLEVPNVIRYEPRNPDRPDWFHEHADAWDVTSATRQVSVVAYLNDVAEGGETEFPLLEFSQRCEKGTVLMFPSNFMFQHLAHPPRSGPKAVVVTWFHFGNQGVPMKNTIRLGSGQQTVPSAATR